MYLTMIQSEEARRKFEQFYTSYRDTMFYFANKILKDEYLSEDVVHQAFLRIIDNLDKIDDISSKKTKNFITIIVENIAIDFYRKRKREYSISFDEIEIYVEDIRADNALIINDVEAAILKLPLNYAIVLKLKFLQGYNNKEISDILKISEVNVRQRISRGKKKLVEMLGKFEVDI